MLIFKYYFSMVICEWYTNDDVIDNNCCFLLNGLRKLELYLHFVDKILSTLIRLMKLQFL